VEGIGGKGRQEKRWIDDIQENMKVYNLDTRIVTYLARDREQYVNSLHQSLFI